MKPFFGWFYLIQLDFCFQFKLNFLILFFLNHENPCKFRIISLILIHFLQRETQTLTPFLSFNFFLSSFSSLPIHLIFFLSSQWKKEKKKIEGERSNYDSWQGLLFFFFFNFLNIFYSLELGKRWNEWVEKKMKWQRGRWGEKGEEHTIKIGVVFGV